MRRFFSALLILFFAIGLTFAGGAQETATTKTGPSEAKTGEPTIGGDLRLVWEPMNTLDVHWTGNDAVWEVGCHIWETPLALDETSTPIPMLTDYEIVDEGRTIILKVREDVNFHNGDTLHADDVIASFNRWMTRATFGKAAFKDLTSVEKMDDYTVVIKMSQPSPTALIALSYPDQGPYIMPEEVIQEAGNGEIKQYIGTGPYKFDQWIPDRHIRLVRFEEYSRLEGEPRGNGGAKKQYLDSITFVNINDPMTRIQALMSNDCQAGIFPIPSIEQLSLVPNIKLVPTGEYSSESITINLKSKFMSDMNMRKAVLYALNQEEIMYGACAGHEDMYSTVPSWGTTGSIYESTTGKDFYNVQDLDKAKDYLKKAGYNGEPLVMYTNGSYETDKNAAMVVAQELREVGFNIDLRAPDWPTVVEARQDPTAFDMIVSGYSMKPDPTLIAFTSIGWPGWWETDTRMNLYYQLLEETDPAKRAQIWDDFTGLIWSELPVIKLGDFYGAIGYLKNVHDIPVDYPWRRFYWNTWMD